MPAVEYSDPVVDIIDDAEPMAEEGVENIQNLPEEEDYWEPESAVIAEEEEEQEQEDNPYTRLAAQEAAKKAKAAAQEVRSNTAGAERGESEHPYKLPSLDLLDPVPERKGGNPAALAKRAKILENLLADF